MLIFYKHIEAYLFSVNLLDIKLNGLILYQADKLNGYCKTFTQLKLFSEVSYQGTDGQVSFHYHNDHKLYVFLKALYKVDRTQSFQEYLKG